MFKDRDAATVRSEGLVCAETAERDSLVPRRPATEEAGAKASAPHASAATSRGLHMLACCSSLYLYSGVTSGAYKRGTCADVADNKEGHADFDPRGYNSYDQLDAFGVADKKTLSIF